MTTHEQTYTCPNCHDLGVLLVERQSISGIAIFARACLACSRGLAIHQRWAAEITEPARGQREPNRLINPWEGEYKAPPLDEILTEARKPPQQETMWHETESAGQP